jgi:hypothetical protein
MKLQGNVVVNSHETIGVRHHDDLDVTTFAIGEIVAGHINSDVTILVRGSSHGRAAFLRRLAAAAERAASSLDAEQVAS